MKRLFHYTTASRLKKILEAKTIKTATAYLANDEKPVVWCTYSQVWEPTATPAIESAETGKVKQLSFAKLTRIDTPVRIEVADSAATMDWNTWRALSGVKPETRQHLTATSRLRCLPMTAVGWTLAGWKMSHTLTAETSEPPAQRAALPGATIQATIC